MSVSGASGVTSAGAQRWRSALPHSRSPAAQTTVQPRSAGHQSRDRGRGARERREHGPAAGAAALQHQGQSRPARGAHECHRRHAAALAVFRRMPGGACAGIHASGAGPVPGGGADGDGSPDTAEERPSGEPRTLASHCKDV